MTDSRGESPVRRSVVVTVISLVVAAVLLVALRSWLDRPVVEEVVVAAPAPELEQPAPIPEPEPVVEQPAESALPVVAAEVASVVTVPPRLLKVLMLPARVERADPAAAALLDAIRQAAIRALHGIPAVEIIDLSAADYAAVVPSNAGPLHDDHLVFLAVTRHYGGDVVAQVTEDSRPDSPSWSIRTFVKRTNGSGMGGGTNIGKNGPARPADDPAAIGSSFAGMITQDRTTASDEGIDIRAEQHVLADTTRSDAERMTAMIQLQKGGHNAESIAGAIDLASRSPSAETRQGAWATLCQTVYDPVLAQPLSYALLTDPHAGVRAQVAFGLAAYLNESGTVAALEHAARTDSSAEVRAAARMAMMDYDGRHEFARDTLLDRSLSPEERFVPTTMVARRYRTAFSSYGAGEQEEMLAIAEIVSATDDPNLKRQALSSLRARTLDLASGEGRNLAPEIIEVLVASAQAEDERVRRSALSAMRGVTAHPEIRAALEAAIENEPELAADLNIAELLARPTSSRTAVPAR